MVATAWSIQLQGCMQPWAQGRQAGKVIPSDYTHTATCFRIVSFCLLLLLLRSSPPPPIASFCLLLQSPTASLRHISRAPLLPHRLLSYATSSSWGSRGSQGLLEGQHAPKAAFPAAAAAFTRVSPAWIPWHLWGLQSPVSSLWGTAMPPPPCCWLSAFTSHSRT